MSDDSSRDESGRPTAAPDPERAAFEQIQQRVAAVALRSAAASGFALAGAGAIRAHGVTDRPTQDVDLFTTQTDPAAFGAAVDEVVAGLGSEGFNVATLRRLDGSPMINSTTTPGKQATKTSCHELGHGVGLAHYTYTSDPEYPGATACLRRGEWTTGWGAGWNQYAPHHVSGHINPWFS